MDATDFSPNARRAVARGNDQVYCTERAPNSRSKETYNSANALKCLIIKGVKWGVTESNRRPAD
jgi:hypothetical protein